MTPERHRGPMDRKRIDVTDPHELLKHSQRMKVRPEDVASAVAKVGDDADAVAEFLGV